MIEFRFFLQFYDIDTLVMMALNLPLHGSNLPLQGRIQDIWKGGSYVKKGVGVRFADFFHFFADFAHFS